MDKHNNKLLEDLYIKEVKLGNKWIFILYFLHSFTKIDEKRSKDHRDVLNAVLEAVLREAKNKSEDFSELYREIYYGGSYYDKLKVKSTDYEYDLNVVFKQPKSSVHISNLGDDYRYTVMYLFIVEAESHIFLPITENQTLRQLEATATTLPQPGRSFLKKIGRIAPSFLPRKCSKFSTRQ